MLDILNLKKIIIYSKIFYLTCLVQFKIFYRYSFVWIIAILFAVLLFIPNLININAADVLTPKSNLSTWFNGSSQDCEDLLSVLKDELKSCGSFMNESNSGSGFWKILKQAAANEAIGGVAEAKDGSKLYFNNLGTSVSSTVGLMFDSKPVDNGYYVNNIAQRLNPVQKVMAQETTNNLIVPNGRAILGVISSIHSSFLQIVFIIYIFIFLIIAFAIMFRQKISGGAYVTIMNSIPRVIISLILVVFSYPIAATVIDLGYASMNVLYDTAINTIEWNIKSSANDREGKPTKLSALAGKTIPTGKSEIEVSKLIENLKPTSRQMNLFRVFGTANLASDALTPGNNGGLQFEDVQIAQGTFNMVNAIGNMFNTMLGAGLSVGTSNNFIVSDLVIVVISIAALFAAFKLFFALLKEFLMILFYPLAAPFMFALYAMPGNDKLIMNWFRNYAGAVFCFVAVYGLFILIAMLGNGLVLNSANAWNPFLLGFVNNPSVGSISALIGYGLFIISPQIPEIVKKSIGTSGQGADKYISNIANETRRAAARLTLGMVG